MLNTSKRWTILLIISCCLGIIAPTLLITAFAFFDPEVMIVKISVLQDYNAHVRMWEAKYRSTFLSYNYYIFTNDTVTTTYSSGSSSTENILNNYLDKGGGNGNGNGNGSGGNIDSENDSILITGSSASSALSDPISSSTSLDRQIKLSPTNFTDQMTLPSSEMIQKYTPLAFTGNISVLIPQQIEIFHNGSYSAYLPLHVYSKKKGGDNDSLKYLGLLPVDLIRRCDSCSTTNSTENIFYVIQTICLVVNSDGIINGSCGFDVPNTSFATVLLKPGENFVQFNEPTIIIKSSSDPYLVAGDLTKGSYTFVMAQEHQKQLGIVFVSLGSVSSLIFVVVIYILLKTKSFITDKKSCQVEMDEIPSQIQANINNINNNSSINNNNNNNNNNSLNNSLPHTHINILNNIPSGGTHNHNNNNNVTNNINSLRHSDNIVEYYHSTEDDGNLNSNNDSDGMVEGIDVEEEDYDNQSVGSRNNSSTIGRNNRVILDINSLRNNQPSSDTSIEISSNSSSNSSTHRLTFTNELSRRNNNSPN